MDLIIYALTGVGAGFLAGLFGIGGGLVIVSALVWIFTMQGFDAAFIPQLAVGTALATIICTSISSLQAHHQRGAVNVPLFWRLAPGLVIGSLSGAFVATRVDGTTLQLIIGSAAALIALKMAFFSVAARQLSDPSLLPPKLAQTSIGGGIGFVSALFGIGGGSLTVPILAHYGQSMRDAVGTSAACGLPIAVAGAAGFALFAAGSGAQLPDHSLGFVYLPAFAAISVMSVFTARLGAKVAHAIPQAKLKKAFAVLLFCVGVQLIISALG